MAFTDLDAPEFSAEIACFGRFRATILLPSDTSSPARHGELGACSSLAHPRQFESVDGSKFLAKKAKRFINLIAPRLPG
jgi:hypothetical protein